MNRPMTEEELGKAWAKMAAAEGHVSRVPILPGKVAENKYAPRIRKLMKEGYPMYAIANKIGISRGRVSQICREAGIKR